MKGAVSGMGKRLLLEGKVKKKRQIPWSRCETMQATKWNA